MTAIIIISAHLHIGNRDIIIIIPLGPRPPIMTAVPPKPMITLQQGITCGQVVSGNTSGMLTSPGYPEYRHNLDCAYIINPPNGYYLQVQLPNFAIEERFSCSQLNVFCVLCMI